MIERTATELSQLLARGETTSETVTDEFLKAIRERDDKIKAFLHVDEADALRQAKAVDQKRQRGEPLFAGAHRRGERPCERLGLLPQKSELAFGRGRAGNDPAEPPGEGYCEAVVGLGHVCGCRPAPQA